MAYEGFLSDTQPARSASSQAACLHCPTRRSCISCDLNAEQAIDWSGLLASSLNLAAGKALFEAGSVAQSVYSVRAGCIKTFTLDAEGHERVQGFYLAGDMIGLDALTHPRYPMHAVAVAPTQVCVMPRSAMRQFAQRTPQLMNRLVDRLSHSLHGALSLAGDYTADQRVAAFLLEMNERLAPLPGRPLHLPMGRRDIANYLRLATETVCRALTRFEQRGLLDVKDRNISIRNRQALLELAEPMAVRELMAA